MKNLNSKEFTKLESADGFYNIGVHPVMDNVLTVTLEKEAGRVGVPGNRWAIDIYTNKLSVIMTSADNNGVYYHFYSMGRQADDEARDKQYSLFATWEELGIHPCAVSKNLLHEYKALMRNLIYKKFFFFILGLGSRARRTALGWLHDIDRSSRLWNISNHLQIIRQGNKYNVFRDHKVLFSSIELERLTVGMLQ